MCLDFVSNASESLESNIQIQCDRLYFFYRSAIILSLLETNSAPGATNLVDTVWMRKMEGCCLLYLFCMSLLSYKHEPYPGTFNGSVLATYSPMPFKSFVWLLWVLDQTTYWQLLNIEGIESGLGGKKCDQNIPNYSAAKFFSYTDT